MVIATPRRSARQSASRSVSREPLQFDDDPERLLRSPSVGATSEASTSTAVPSTPSRRRPYSRRSSAAIAGRDDPESSRNSSADPRSTELDIDGPETPRRAQRARSSRGTSAAPKLEQSRPGRGSSSAIMLETTNEDEGSDDASPAPEKQSPEAKNPPEREEVEEALAKSALVGAPTSTAASSRAPKKRLDSTARRLAVRRRLFGMIGRIGPILRPLLILAALVLLLLLPSPRPPFSRNTYVDENALQPGSANNYWDWREVRWSDALARQVKDVAHESAQVRADFLSAKLSEVGLEPHTQRYSFALPNGQVVAGVNTYARWLSGRSDGREAMIIAAGWKSRWDGRDDPDVDADNISDAGVLGDDGARRTNVRGLAITLALARYLTAQSHWSKDIIFVFSDGYMDGMQAWSNAYFGAKVQDKLEAELVTSAQGAVVWNAIAIDYPSDSFESLALLHEGKDGQLPNMDVLNTLVKITENVAGGHSRVPVRLPGSTDDSRGHRDDQSGGGWGSIGRLLEDKMGWGWGGVGRYRKGSMNLWHQMKSQAAGHPTGMHGLFQRFHVDAITIFAVPAKGPFGFWHLGRILEAQVRSYSNLIERLHHSQFFYLLTGPHQFVQLGVYLPVAILLSVALTLTGMAKWLHEGRKARSRQVGLVRLVQGPSGDSATAETQAANDVPLATPTLADLRLTLAVQTLQQTSDQDSAVQRRTLSKLLEALDAEGRPIGRGLLSVVWLHLLGYAIFNLWAVESPAGLADSSSSSKSVTHPLEQSKAFIYSSAIALHIFALPWMLRLASALFSPLSTVAGPRVDRRIDTNGDAGRHDIAETRLLSMLPPMCPRRKRVTLAHLLHAFTLIEAGMVVAVLSVLNFSAATVTALFLVFPLYLLPLPSCGFSVRHKAASNELEIDTSAGGPISLAAAPSATSGGVFEYPWTTRVTASHRLRTLCAALLLIAILPWNLAGLAKVVEATRARPWSPLRLVLRLIPGLHNFLSDFDIDLAGYLKPAINTTTESAHAAGVSGSAVDKALAAALWDWHVLGTQFLPLATLVYSPIVLQAAYAAILVATA